MTDPIDVYSEWIDECERVNKNNSNRGDDEERGEEGDDYDDDEQQVNEDSDEEQVQYS